MKEYRVAVHFEEGFVVHVNATSKEEAHKTVFDMVDQYGAGSLSGEVVHRDWQIDLIEERDLEPKTKEYRVSFVPTESLNGFTVEAFSEEEANEIALQDLRDIIEIKEMEE